MKNQHTKIKGYRDLSQAEIDLMNRVKEMGVQLGNLLEDLAANDADGRWLSIAKTDLQKGLMAATRAVAKPDFF